MGEIYEVAVKMDLDTMVYILNYVKIGSDIQKVILGRTQTAR
jgi:hypothetical protein